MEIKEKLLQSFNYNKKNVSDYYNLAKNDKFDGIDYKLAVAEHYGKCKVLASILKQDFDTDVMDELKVLRYMNDKMYEED